ncbi:beta-ketoacyl synthase chain length factor [Nitrospira sp. NS4]|uniref:beta-ketoacyl synthase chain length factor n=1 Tax=Nitrospira sp. NS4 TaxID=3414498 RepID=UPI003C2E848F
MKVAIQSIGVLAPGLSGWEASRRVLAGAEPFMPAAVPDPEAALLPPNERRRSSDSVRWAVQVAQEAMAQSGLNPRDVPTVFASSGGEMGVLDALCRTLATPERIISPTLFHQSVHNTAAGYWGIATACQQSSTALSCYDDSFAAGLLEAVAFVCVEQCPVLLVAYDLAVPFPLNEARPIGAGFAVAFVLAPSIPSALANMSLRLEEAGEGGASRLQEPVLERVRRDNPAARSLPLLCAIAAGGSQRVALSLLESQQVVLDLEPCRL